MPEADSVSPTTHEPNNSKFKQQALPAWQPILTAGTVLPTFFVIGVAFIPIGVGLMYFSDQVHEVEVKYTDCINQKTEQMCREIITDHTTYPDYHPNGTRLPCECVEKIDPKKIGDTPWEGDVFIYYGLTNFYQNHRRYVKSRDDKQLFGDLESKNDDCNPFLYPPGGEKKQVYAPCGAIANSLFNDTIFLEYCTTSTTCEDDDPTWANVSVTNTGIAWASDKDKKFQNPGGKNDLADLKKAFENTIKPMDWQKEIWQLDEKNPDNNGFQNEDLIVWMRTAALPNFRKLYRKVIRSEPFTKGLPSDYSYRLRIKYNFEVSQFQGTKSVYISTTSILGGKNPFLGIAYIVVGCICFLMGIIFLFIHLRFGRTTQEMMNINPRSQYNEHQS